MSLKLWGTLSKLQAQLEAKPLFSSVEVGVGQVSLIRHQFDEINKAISTQEAGESTNTLTQPDVQHGGWRTSQGFDRLGVFLNLLTLTIRFRGSAVSYRMYVFISWKLLC